MYDLFTYIERWLCQRFLERQYVSFPIIQVVAMQRACQVGWSSVVEGNQTSLQEPIFETWMNQQKTNDRFFKSYIIL